MSRRHKARELLVQALYASEVGDKSLADAIQEQIERRKPGQDGEEFVRARAALLENSLQELDAEIDAALTGWAPERVSIVERCILRLALSELRQESDVPPGAVLDEAIELARDFSGEKAVQFVNGVLDRLLNTSANEPPEGEAS